MLVAGALAVSSGVVPATAQTASEGPCPADTPRAPFTDVAGGQHPRRGDRLRLRPELVAGVSADRFAPQRAVTRAQAASLVARALDEAGVALPAASAGPTSPTSPRHTATTSAACRPPASSRAARDGTFGGGAEVTREQFASLMVRALSFARGPTSWPPRAAPSSTSRRRPHTANVDAAAEQGLLQGRADGTFAPAATTRRDQARQRRDPPADRTVRGGDFQTAGGEVWVLDQGTDRIHVYDGDDGFEELSRSTCGPRRCGCRLRRGPDRASSPCPT